MSIHTRARAHISTKKASTLPRIYAHIHLYTLPCACVCTIPLELCTRESLDKPLTLGPCLPYPNAAPHGNSIEFLFGHLSWSVWCRVFGTFTSCLLSVTYSCFLHTEPEREEWSVGVKKLCEPFEGPLQIKPCSHSVTSVGVRAGGRAGALTQIPSRALEK